MSDPAKAFKEALRAHQVASASSALNRLKEALRGASWHQEYVRVRQEDLREVLNLPEVKQD